MRENSVMTLAAIKSAAKEIGDLTLPMCRHSDDKVSETAIRTNRLAQEIYKISELIERMEKYTD